MKSTSIFVMGMHRCGTSALTGVLNLLGVGLGDHLMTARPDNEKGFWENERIVQLNDRILASLGMQWDDIVRLPDGWLDRVEITRYQGEVEQLIRSEYGGLPLWGLKDPRLSRLFPLYQRALHALDCHAKVMISYRDPIEVARSLSARDGMSIDYGLVLWVRYMIDAEKHTRGVERAFVSYHDLLSDWRGQISAVERDLGLIWPVTAEDAAADIENFLSLDLRHQKSSDKAQCHPALRQLAYLIYNTIADADQRKQLPEILDRLSASMEKMYRAFKAELADRELHLPYDEAFPAEYPHQNLILEGAIVYSLFKEMLRENQSRKIVSLSHELECSKADLERSKADLERLQTEKDELEHWLDYVRSSRSWQLTRPFRLVVRLWERLNTQHFRMDGRRLALAVHILRQQGPQFLLRHIMRKLRQKPFFPKRRQYAAPTLEQVEYIELPACDRPVVSIIIPVYNKFEYTFACVKSILEYTKGSFEVIIVDDCSSDMTCEGEKYIAGVHWLHNAENLGFIGSCNAGAAVAGGKYLLFLNNDTLVTEHWLDAMLQCVSEAPDTGLVGAKLIYPDGRLQEAGGIVWQDGSGWNFGRFDDPDKPEYNYVRQVDYCSGACILISRDLFNAVGRFDDRYRPAYYEDTDLAYSVRHAGKKVVYQPFAEIIHFEGITSGTDTASGTKRYQLINQKKFREKWADALKSHMPPGSDPLQACDRLATRRVLVIDAYTPMPDRDSGSLRMYRILKLLVDMGCKVTFSAENLAYDPRYSRDLRHIGVETLCYPYTESMEHYLQQYGGVFDAVVLSRRDVADRYLTTVRRHCARAKLIFDTVDLHFVRESREKHADTLSEDVQWHEESMSKELSLAGKVNEVWVVSDEEKKLLREIAPDLNVEVVSNVHEVAPTQTPFSARKGILFVGSFMHPPNIDAVNFYFEQVHGKVREILGVVPFFLIGKDPPRDVRKWQEMFPEITLTGYVEDIRPYFEQVRLSIAPLRYGAGVKGKINSSMSFGVPVVTTTVGAEGMDLIHANNAMVADDPEDFARAVAELYENEELWQHVVQEGFKNISTKFSFSCAERALRHSLFDMDYGHAR